MASAADAPDDGLYNEKNWENPFAPGTYLHELFEDAISEERDVLIIVDDFLGRRGTGKTDLTLQLIDGMDQTAAGITSSKATLQPEELRNAYTGEQLRSGLAFDEGEYGASNRDAMTLTNKAIREVVSMGRVEQKYVVINAPIKGFIDRDLQKLADAWISVVRKGLALVHQLKWEAYSEQLLTPKKQWLEWDAIPRGTQLREVYNELDAEKKKRLRREGEKEYYTAQEVAERERKAREDARMEMRNSVIQRIMTHPEIQELVDDRILQQRMVAEAVDLDPSRVSQIINGES